MWRTFDVYKVCCLFLFTLIVDCSLNHLITSLLLLISFSNHFKFHHYLLLLFFQMIPGKTEFGGKVRVSSPARAPSLVYSYLQNSPNKRQQTTPNENSCRFKRNKNFISRPLAFFFLKIHIAVINSINFVTIFTLFNSPRMWL